MDVTNWARTNLLAKESKLAFQLASLLFNFSMVNPESCGEEVCLMGNPEYFPKFGVDLNPNNSHKLAQFSRGTLGEKKTLVLVALTF